MDQSAPQAPVPIVHLNPSVFIVLILMLLVSATSFYFGARYQQSKTQIPYPTIPITETYSISPITTKTQVSNAPTQTVPTTAQETQMPICQEGFVRVCEAGNCECLEGASNAVGETTSCQTVADCYPGSACDPKLIEMYGNTSHCPVPSCVNGQCYWNAVP